MVTKGEKWHYIALKSEHTDNNDYCNEEMPTQFNKTLKYNHGEKSLKHHS